MVDHHVRRPAHDRTRGGIDKLGTVFEIAVRYGEREWKIGCVDKPGFSACAICEGSDQRESLTCRSCDGRSNLFRDNSHRRRRGSAWISGAHIVRRRDQPFPTAMRMYRGSDQPGSRARPRSSKLLACWCRRRKGQPPLDPRLEAIACDPFDSRRSTMMMVWL